MTCTARDTEALRDASPESARRALERLLGSMDAARAPLDELRAALGGDGCQGHFVVATTAALGVYESAVAFLDLAARAHREPPAKYRVTCPECGAESITEWTDDLPPGGVSPVVCSWCGYMILSESEGDPVLVPNQTSRAPSSEEPRT